MSACVPSEEPHPPSDEISPVEVGQAPGSAIQPDRDMQAPQREPEMIGVLPLGFPASLPVYVPSSLLDFEDTASGGYIILKTTDPLATVKSQFTDKLRSHGWQPAGSGDASRRYSRDGVEARVSYEARGPDTLIRIEY